MNATDRSTWRAGRRRLLHGAIAGAGALALPGAVRAQAAAYPTRPIRMVVPFSAGGPADSIGRLAAGGLQQALGQPVVVENRLGAGGIVGAEAVATSPPDGYTLLLCNVGDTMAVSLYRSLPYDFARDLRGVSLMASTPFIVTVHPAVPARTLSELIALARARPGTVTYGSAGLGVSSHLAGEALGLAAGVRFLHVPYKGQAPAVTDLLGGQIQFMFGNPVIMLPHIASGKVRALAVTGTTRLPQAPDIPTAAEAGVPGFEADTWFGIAVPSKTPDPIVERLSSALAAHLNAPDTRRGLEAQGAVVVASTPTDFGRRIGQDIERWRKVITTAGIKLD
jgi:tripartite-type tricarboxylate transporter receptor subunit TctC